MSEQAVAPPKAARQLAERDAILRVAYRLIGRNPESPVSVQEILDGAGLSTRAFYRHFRSKDELILIMYSTALDRVLAELREIVARAETPPAALDAFVFHQLAVIYDARRARQTKVLNSAEARSASGFDELHQHSNEALRSILAAVIRQGMSDGSFPDATDPVEDSRAVVSAIGGVVSARLVGRPVPPWSDAAAHLSGLFRRAFGAV